MDSSKDVVKLLKQHNLRSTPARRGVLEVLAKQEKAVASNELEEAIGADRITIYRTLRTLEASGFLHRIKDTTGVDKYALCGMDCSSSGHVHTHAHFHCTKCEATTCMNEVEVAQPVLPKGYQIQDSHLTYTGICAGCS